MALGMKAIFLLAVIASSALADVPDYYNDFESLLLHRMNLSADPCNDFYNYACGLSTEKVGDIDETNEKILLSGLNRLAEPSYNGNLLESTAVANIVKFYRACRNSYITKPTIYHVWQYIQSFMDKFNVPFNLFEAHPDLVIDPKLKPEMLFYAFDHFMVEPFFSFEGRQDELKLFAPNLEGNPEELLCFGPGRPSTTFDRSEYTCENQENVLQKFVEAVEKIRPINGWSDVTLESIKITAKKLMDIEYVLADVRCDGDVNENSHNSNNISHKTLFYTIDDLKASGNLFGVGKYAELFIQTETKGRNIDPNSVPISTTEEDINWLNNVAANISDNDFLLYIYFRSLRNLKLINNLPREKSCFDLLRPFPQLLSRVFLEFKFQSIHERQKVQKFVRFVFRYTQDKLMEMMMSVDWVKNDRETVNWLRNKMYTMKADISINELLNYTWLDGNYQFGFDKTDDFMDMLYKVERFLNYQRKWRRDMDFDSLVHYNVFSNKIIISDYELVAPTLNVHYPYPFNFGSVGSLVGQRISTAFAADRISLSVFNEPILSEAAFGKILDMGICVGKHYNEMQNISESNTRIIKHGQIGDKMSDISGLEAAYRVYSRDFYGKKWLTHPKLRHLTHDQLFFLGFAGEFCGQKQNQEMILEGVRPIPNEIRVKGALRNVPAFAKAFQCPVGSQYAPEKRCRVWVGEP